MSTEAEIKQAVQQAYAAIATGTRSGCGASCGTDLTALRTDGGGYSPEERASLPAGAALGLGCGVPTRLLPIQPGMTVLDLGSGAGIDVFLAAREAGPAGKVIGVDMTPAMIEKARANAAAGGYTNVEFRLGDIESLPVASGTVDVILSNCVINLAPDKRRVFREAHRVLKPGGRMQISDIVTSGQMPEEVRRDLEQWAGCLAGAVDREDYLAIIRAAGFSRVEVAGEFAYDSPGTGDFRAVSINLIATK